MKLSNLFFRVLLANAVIFVIIILVDRWNLDADLKMGLPFLWLGGIDILIFLGLVAWYKETAKLFILFASILFLIGFSICSNNL